jgi:hypothetical protein
MTAEGTNDENAPLGQWKTKSRRDGGNIEYEGLLWIKMPSLLILQDEHQ